MKNNPSPFLKDGKLDGWVIEILPNRFVIFDAEYKNIIDTIGIPKELVHKLVVKEQSDDYIKCIALRKEFRKKCIEKYGSMSNVWKIILLHDKKNKGK